METTAPTSKVMPEPEARSEPKDAQIDLDRYPVEVLEAVLKILRERKAQ